MEYVTQIAPIITALVLAFNCWQTWRNGERAKKIATDVKTIEVATNSMKDALVAATAKAAFGEGKAVGLEKGRNEERK